MKRYCLLSRPLLAAVLAPFCLLADGTPSPGWIVIPANEYQALRARAFPPEPAVAPSVEKTLTRVEYDLKIDGALASGRASLTVDVLKDGWVQVPIPANLLVREARLEGKLLPLSPGRGAGAPSFAVLAKRGRSVLQLEIVLPVAASGGQEHITLPATPSGVTRASVLMPRAGMDVHVISGVLTGETPGEGGATWTVYGNANQPLIVAWRRKHVDTPPSNLPVRYRGSLTELVGLGEDAASVYAEVAADVVQGALAEVRIAVPPTVTVNQVLGGSVGDWEASGDILSVHLLEPAEKSARFVISGETRLPREGAAQIPLLRLPDAEREEGGVAAEVIGSGEATDLKPAGLERTDASALGPLVAGRQSPSLVAFRFLARGADRSLALNIVRYTQQAVLTANIEEARYRVLLTREGKTLVEAQYAVRNSQKPFLKIALPANAVLWEASLNGTPLRPNHAPDGGLLLPLPKSESGEEAATAAVGLLYLVRDAAWTDRGRAALPLPSIDLPISKTGLELHYPPGFRITAEPGAFHAQPAEAPVSAVLRGETAEPSAAPQAANAAPSDILQQFNSNAAQSANQALVDKFRARMAGRTAAKAAPVEVSFPALGASLYLASELTGENTVPAVPLSYQREHKGGVK